MCGRYTLIRLSDFTDMFPWIHLPDELPPPRYNIAPTQPVAVVPNDGSNKLDFYHWGLIPYWAKDKSVGNRMINARAETLASKPAFRDALKRRRCLIPTSGFYEWRKSPDGKTKQPMYIRMRGGKPFAFAGLWEKWRDESGNTVPSATVITTDPNLLMRDIHDRMPVIIQPEHYQRWLSSDELTAEHAAPMLAPYPESEMEAYPVDRLVNSPANESAQCIDPRSEAPTDVNAKSEKQPSLNPGLFD